MATNHEKEMIEKMDRAIAPSIFIGLGGVGCKIVSRLATLARKEAADDDKNIVFVAMDTDVNDLRRVKAANKNVITIQTSSRKTIGEYLEIDSNAREKWFPINDILLKKTPTEGAGQIRAISNLVAHNATRQGELIELNKAIDSLFPLSTDEMQQSARVTIIGSVTGGTGSGLFLPIALYVRDYLEKARQQKSSIFRGFFFLPDAMAEVIDSEVEKDNLRSNAYASVREIDAFMRWRYDYKLRERYPNLRVIMPKVGGGGYSEFNDAPFNFCFLFNQLDNNSESMFSHRKLLDHAAECLYDMTISPISGRVNSQEDNIIREITKHRNSSSYAGAGCSKMVYPYEAVKRYVALNWAKKVISTEWMDADKSVAEKKAEKEKQRNEGGIYVEESDIQLFTNHVSTEAANENSFYQSIVSQCREMIEKTGQSVDLSALYVTDLAMYTEKTRKESIERTSIQDDLDEAMESIKAATSNTDVSHGQQNEERHSRSEHVTSALESFFKAHDKKINQAKMQILHITSAIISAQYTANTKKDIPCLEKYMYRTPQIFMHPTAARYFLMSLSLELEKQILVYKQKFKDTKELYQEQIAELEKHRFDDDTVDEADENPLVAWVLKNRKEKFTPSQRAEAVQKALKALLLDGGDRDNGLLEDYCYYLVNAEVFERINAYVKSIIDGYGEFFVSIKGDMETLDQQMAELEKSFANTSGIATMHVCSSQKCLKALASFCKCTIGAFDLPVDLTTAIYNKAKKYAKMKKDGSFDEQYGLYEESSSEERTAALQDFFGDVFENVIMNFWVSSVQKTCKDKLDMDIIRAVYTEARIENNYNHPNDQLAYLMTRIRGAENLASPFIDAPNGEPRTISIYAMNSDVESSLNEVETRELDTASFKRIASPEIDKYSMRFYQSVYNIRAKDLVKFSCAKDTSKGNSDTRFGSCGLYSRVYHERLAKIEPLDADNTEITPHIEKNWQYINVLPELDEEFQAREEVRIAKAFVYALISGKIAYRQHDSNGYNFCYEIIDPSVKAPELYVSNGTRCDQFYELLDAFTLCPRYVDRLLELMERDIQFEKNLGRAFEDSRFATEQANGVVVDEFSIFEKFSIFHIPLLYKASAASNYLEAWGEAMITAIFEIIDDYVSTLEEPRAVNDVKCRFLSKDIYEYYHNTMDTLAALKDGDPHSKLVRKHSRLERIKNDSLTLRVYDLIAEELEASDALNPHVGQYSEPITRIKTARKLLSSDILIDAGAGNDSNDDSETK